MTARRHGYRVIASVAGAFLLGVWEIRAAEEPPVAAEDALRSFCRKGRGLCAAPSASGSAAAATEGADPLSRLMNRRYLAAAIRAGARSGEAGRHLHARRRGSSPEAARGGAVGRGDGGAHPPARRRGRKSRVPPSSTNRFARRRATPFPAAARAAAAAARGHSVSGFRFGSRALGRSCGHRHRCPARRVPCAIHVLSKLFIGRRAVPWRRSLASCARLTCGLFALCAGVCRRHRETIGATISSLFVVPPATALIPPGLGRTRWLCLQARIALAFVTN